MRLSASAPISHGPIVWTVNHKALGPKIAICVVSQQVEIQFLFCLVDEANICSISTVEWQVYKKLPD